MAAQHDRRVPYRKIGGLSPWFSLLGGGVAWTLHLLVGYAVAEFGCVSYLANHAWLGISAVAWMLLALTLVTMALAAASAWMAWRGEQATPPLPEATDMAAADHYIVRVGIITNLIFIFIIVAQSIPIFFFLRDC